MVARDVAVVFGGSGFIGRYVVQRLAGAGHIVRVAGRDPEKAGQLRPMGAVGQIVPLYAPLANEAAVKRAVEGARMAVNLVGILAESRAGNFERTHAEGAGAVAKAAAVAGVARLVHVSAIGADAASPSLYAKSKAGGEARVREAFPRATILRPSVVFGAEDQFFNRFGAMAAMLPFMPVLSGTSRFQPVYVGDVANAVIAALTRPEVAGVTYELGGPEVMSFRDILAYILKVTHRHRRMVAIPPGLAALKAKFLERLPGKLLTTDQLRLLAHDNVANPEIPGLTALGIVPTPIGLVVPEYLARFRPGGGRREMAHVN